MEMYRGKHRPLFSMLLTIIFLTASGTGCARYSADGYFYALLLQQLQNSSTDNGSWINRKKITIDNSAQNENLTDFPVLVVLNSSRIDYSKTRNSGQDIRFYDSDGITALPYEIEKWDESANSYVWVKIPQIDALSSSDYFYIYYNNSSASDGQNVTSVWDTSYKTVLHMNGGATNSSATSGNDGTDNGTSDITGQIGNARDFNGITTSITIPSIDWNKDAGTVEAWAFSRTTPGGSNNVYVISHVNGSPSTTNTRIYLYIRNSGAITDNYGTSIGDCSPGSCTTGQSLSLNQFYHFSMTWRKTGPTTGSFQSYLNGSPINPAGSYNPSGFDTYGLASTATVGDYAGGGENFDGIIDEVRLSSTVRSGAWVAAQYKSMTDSYVSFGTEEAL